jgi:cold shock protein
MAYRPNLQPDPTPPGERQEGAVKWFNSEKGYGFISPANGAADLFLHHSAIQNLGGRPANLEEGQPVSFVAAMSPKGPMATEVQLVDG